jgi:hypothetical protein
MLSINYLVSRFSSRPLHCRGVKNSDKSVWVGRGIAVGPGARGGGAPAGDPSASTATGG